MNRRRSLSAPDIPAHTNPIPAATVVGNLLFTSAIGGEDPGTHALPDDPGQQIANVFQTIQAILREAGASTDDVGKVSVFLRNKPDRKLVNPHWVAMFPDEDSRPVRHTVEADLPPGRYIQVELIAVLPEA